MRQEPTIQRPYDFPVNAAHSVPMMLCLECLPGRRSKKWHIVMRMHEAGRANMERAAKEISKQEGGWHAWRIVEEYNPHAYRTELTPEGEQAVIPGCERNASDRAKQLDLF